MKLLFCLDVTNGDKKLDGEELITRKTDSRLFSSLEESDNTLSDIAKRSDIPKALQVVRMACGLLALALAAGILKAKVSLSQAYSNAPALFWVLGILSFTWLALTLWGKRRARKARSDPKSAQALDEYKTMLKAAHDCLGVPEDAYEMDVFTCEYRRKNGEPKIVRTMGDRVYLNFSFYVWREGSSLCFADDENRFEIPVASFKAVRRNAKKVSFLSWNKDEAPSDARYRAWKITSQGNTINSVRYTLMISLSCGGEEYELQIPPWEAKPLADLSGWNLNV